MDRPKTLAVKLKTVAEKIVKRGHPWIFSKSISKINRKGKAGDVVVLFGGKSNKVYAVGLYDPNSPVVIKLVHNGGPATLNQEFFRKKIITAFKKRAPLLATDTNAYRLLFGENDDFPGMIVDIYDKVGVVKIYSEVWIPYLEMIAPLIAEITQVESVVLRMSRHLQKESLPYKEGSVIFGNLTSPEVIFKEYGVQFKINVLLGHKTGFFLDHRDNRHRIGQMAKGKTVLDVFSYAGGFSIHCLAGGATEVTSLDFSKQALELAKINASLNPHSGKHHTLAGDAFEILKDLKAKNQTFDIVIIDPPSFAKRKEEREIAKKKYAELAQLGAALTNKGGLLVLASCSSRINEDVLIEVHRDEFRKLGVNYRLEDVTQHDIDHPVSFPEGAYLKTAYYRIL